MTLRAGFAAADITPEVPCELNGFAARRQPARSVAMALKARVLLLAEGRRRCALAVCDVLGFTVQDARRLEKALAEAAGTPPRHTVVICTHTHAGPMSMPLGNVGIYDRDYVDAVADALQTAGRAARDNLAAVDQARLASRHVPDLAFYRCAADEPDRRRWPGELTALRLDRAAAEDIVIAHLGAHALCLGHDNRQVHPDYPGALCQLMEAEGLRALFLPGCGADVHPTIAEQAEPEAAHRYAERLAREIHKLLPAAGTAPMTPLRCTQRTLDLAYGFHPDLTAAEKAALTSADASPRARRRMERNTCEWRAEAEAGNLPTRTRFPMRFLRLGDLVLACLPAEVFCQTGQDLDVAVPSATVRVVSQAGGNAGYLPREVAYRRLTYEVTSAQEWYRTDGALLPSSEPQVRRAAADAAASLMRPQAAC